MSSTTALHVIADPHEPGAAEVQVCVDVAGAPYRFLLDSGAARSRLIDDSLTATFAHAATHAPTGRGALGDARTSRRAVVPSLRLGSIEAFDFEIDIEDDPEGPPSILGLDFLTGHRLDFWFSKSLLVIDEPRSVGTMAPLIASSHGHPHVDVGWEAITARAVWDSGAGVTVVDTGFVRRYPELFEMQAPSMGRDAERNEHATPMAFMAPCRIGNKQFDRSLAAIADIAGIQPDGDPPFEIILGYPLISQADWRIDLKEAAWAYL